MNGTKEKVPSERKKSINLNIINKVNERIILNQSNEKNKIKRRS